MPPMLFRPTVVCANQSLHLSLRRSGNELSRLPSLRPIHASHIVQRPRRRDFFSSNPALGQPKSSSSEEANGPKSGSEQHQLQRRKTLRAPAAKTSLRRVAVEAQRSKDETIHKMGPYTADAPTPRSVTAYAVAEKFDLAKVVEILRREGYEPDPLGTGLYPQVIHIQVPIDRKLGVNVRHLPSSEIGDLFIFPSGTVVTWALPEGFTSFFATRTLLPAAKNPHAASAETEDLEYVEDVNREHSLIRGDTIVLGTKIDATPVSNDEVSRQTIGTVLTKIAFSSGFARSTNLAVLETNLESYLASTSDIPRLLSKGSRLPTSMSRRFILRKTGQLLSLRAQLNLYSELTDSLPDLFWDSRSELKLENYYDEVGKALDVGIRIKTLNSKMDYAQELATVLREQLSEKHGLFLEWTIIVLIAIEVGFEVLRLQREGFWKNFLTEISGGGPERHDACNNTQMLERVKLIWSSVRA